MTTQEMDGSAAGKHAAGPRAGSRLAGLDGLRGVAVLVVICGHCFYNRNVALPVWASFLEQGSRGVTVFFVLSGFLITKILVNEHARSGSVSLKKFYIRRAFRIFPAFYAFLGTVAVLAALRVIPVSVNEWLVAALFVRDYATDGPWWVAHTWSLAVEEQFYLLWPLLFLLLKPARAKWFIAAAIVLAPLVRVAQYVAFPETRGIIAFMFHTRADALLVGCLLAVVLSDGRWSAARDRVAAAWPLAVALLMLVGPFLSHTFGGVYLLTVGWSVEQLAVAVLIVTAVTAPASPFTRAMSWRPLTVVGTLSFSLYLWQQLFLTSETVLPVDNVALGLACTLAAAVASYRLVEKPFLRLKVRYETAPVVQR